MYLNFTTLLVVTNFRCGCKYTNPFLFKHHKKSCLFNLFLTLEVISLFSTL